MSNAIGNNYECEVNLESIDPSKLQNDDELPSPQRVYDDIPDVLQNQSEMGKDAYGEQHSQQHLPQDLHEPLHHQLHQQPPHHQTQYHHGQQHRSQNQADMTPNLYPKDIHTPLPFYHTNAIHHQQQQQREDKDSSCNHSRQPQSLPYDHNQNHHHAYYPQAFHIPPFQQREIQQSNVYEHHEQKNRPHSQSHSGTCTDQNLITPQEHHHHSVPQPSIPRLHNYRLFEPTAENSNDQYPQEHGQQNGIQPTYDPTTAMEFVNATNQNNYFDSNHDLVQQPVDPSTQAESRIYHNEEEAQQHQHQNVLELPNDQTETNIDHDVGDELQLLESHQHYHYHFHPPIHHFQHHQPQQLQQLEPSVQQEQELTHEQERQEFNEQHSSQPSTSILSRQTMSQQQQHPQSISNVTQTSLPTPNHQSKPPKISAEQAWRNRFEELRTFYAENGHSDVPQTYSKNKSLGKWVGKQREHYKIFLELKQNTDNHSTVNMHEQPTSKRKKRTCPLTQERIDKLSTLDFKFSIGKGKYSALHGTLTSSEKIVQAWEDKFKLLELYKSIHGHVDVIVPSPSARTSTMLTDLPATAKRLDATSANESLGNFLEENKDCASIGTTTPATNVDPGQLSLPTPVTTDTVINHPTHTELTVDQIKSLARWLSTQRKKYREMTNKTVASSQVLKDRFERLSTLGVDLNSGPNKIRATIGKDATSKCLHGSTNRQVATWNTRYKELCDFKDKFGHVNVSLQNSKSYPQLARWVTSQRELWRAQQGQTDVEKIDNCSKATQNGYSLSKEKIALLKEIGFEFSIFKKTFTDRLNELKQYKQKEGHMEVRASENKPLYDWIHRQRLLFRNHMQGNMKNKTKMSNERIKQLEDIGFDWKYSFEVVDKSDVKLAIETAASCSQSPNKRKKTNIGAMKGFKNKDDGSGPSNVTQSISYQELSKPSDELNTNILSLPRLDSLGMKHNNINSRVLDESDMATGPIATRDQLRIKVTEDHAGKTFNEADLFLNPNLMRNHKKGTKPQLWKKNYDALVDFHSTYGHCRVPGKYARNPKLGYWVKLQREGKKKIVSNHVLISCSKTFDTVTLIDYKHLKENKPSPMNDFRINLLEKIGFEWSIKPYDNRMNTWYEKLEELKAYRVLNGDCDVPQVSSGLICLHLISSFTS